MKSRLSAWSILAAMLAVQTLVAQQTGAREPVRRALLIGVTKFLNAGIKVAPLNGPENDVTLFKSVLVSVGVPAANISTLAGLPADKAKQPIKENIRREFAALANAARADGGRDQIVILFAGHGSQQPNDDQSDDEPDGFDEIFIPADIGPWDGSRHTVTNAIVDDEIKQWLTEIRNTGASVWVIFDACHSGTMTRGAADEVEPERQAPMKDLGIPADEIAKAKAQARRGSGSKSVLGLLDNAGDITAMYAADSEEKTIEKRMEPGDRPFYGLFTYTISSILKEIVTPISYRELSRRVLDRYRAMQRFASTPAFEGGGLDNEILGERTWPGRPQIVVSAGSNATWTVDAGTILGVTPGSILEVFPPAGGANADRAVGHVKVLTAQALSATVQPSAFGKVPAPAAAALVAGSRARVVYYSPGSQRLKIALQGAAPPALERAMAGLAKETRGLAERADVSEADWFVRVEGTDVAFVPAGGWQPDRAPIIGCEPGRAPQAVRQFRIDDVTSPRLAERLYTAARRVARVANLSRLGTQPGTGVDFNLGVQRFDGPIGGTGRSLLSPPLKDAIVRDGEYVEFRMKNLGTTPIDVTLLYVDASFAITSIFPWRDEQLDVRIAQGQERTRRVPITACPRGWESTVAVAVEGTGARQNFSALEQEGFSRGAQDLDSPLRQLLEGAAFGRGTRGDPDPEPLDHFAVKVVSWRTEGRD